MNAESAAKLDDAGASITSSKVLELQGVSRYYRRGSETVTALEDIDLVLDTGKITAVVGPSGSGKSTLLAIVTGADYPDEGDVWRSNKVRADWSGLAVIPQGLGLIDELTALENVQMPQQIVGRAAVDGLALLETLGLEKLGRRSPNELSVGEQQRVAVARALSTEPFVLVADEPTAHQDDVNASSIISLLAAAATRGAAVLVATHDQRVITRADAVIELVDGRSPQSRP